jgi:hypothetical protein
MAMPTTRVEVQRVAVPSNTEAKRLVSQTRRKLADMPALPAQMNSYAAILVYTASGLSDAEISVATGFSVEQVLKLRAAPAYSVLEENIINAVKQESTQEVNSILARGKVRAAQRIVEMVDSEVDVLALKAADSLLDRTGHKAVEKVEVNHMQMLRIEVVDKQARDIPIIDMER